MNKHKLEFNDHELRTITAALSFFMMASLEQEKNSLKTPKKVKESMETLFEKLSKELSIKNMEQLSEILLSCNVIRKKDDA